MKQKAAACSIFVLLISTALLLSTSYCQKPSHREIEVENETDAKFALFTSSTITARSVTVLHYLKVIGLPRKIKQDFSMGKYPRGQLSRRGYS